MGNQLSATVPITPESQITQTRTTSDDPHLHVGDTDGREATFITNIRAIDVACDSRRLPVGFYIAINIDGKTTAQTSTRSASDGENAVEWDDEILLPSTPSSIISFNVYALFEPRSRSGDRELVSRFNMSVGEAVNGKEHLESIRVPALNGILPSCSSLRITSTRRRICSVNEISVKVDNPSLWSLYGLANLVLAGLRMLLDFLYQGNNDRTIARLEHTVQATPDDHPGKPALVHRLADLLLTRFENLGDPSDLNRSILMYEQALRIIPNDYTNKLVLLGTLGNSLFHRFELLGDLKDIEKAMSMNEQAVNLAPDDYPKKPILLNNFGSSLLGHFRRCSDPAFLDRSILMFEDAIQLTPNGHPNKPSQFSNLGSALFARSQCLDSISDLERSIIMNMQAVRYTRNGHPSQLARMINLASSLWSRFERLSDHADMHNSILAYDEVIRLASDNDPNKPGWMKNLGHLILTRFETLGDFADINRSIELLEKAVHLTSDSHPDRPDHLELLGSSLLGRFECLDDLADLERSILMFKEAIHLTPEGHSDMPGRMGRLASSFTRRFQYCGDLADAENSISMLEEALRLLPEGHSNKPVLLHNLASSLFIRFERLGDLADVDRSVLMYEQAALLTANNDPGKHDVLNGLGTSLVCRFECIGNLADVNKSITVLEEAVRLTPYDHPSKPTRLGNIGNALCRRFERLGDTMDIDRSISMLEEAVSLAPDGHTSKTTWLNNLGHSLCLRFDHLGDITDIDESILMNDEVLGLTPEGHPERSSRMNNSGISLLRRFERTKNVEDIDQSISMFEQAVLNTPEGHPDKALLMSNLGSAFLTRFRRSRNPSDLSAATSHLSITSRASTGDSRTRFRSVRSWISALRLQGNSNPALLDAYATAIDLLPQLAWLGLPLVERHVVLVEAAYIARDAASAALDAGRAELAVEWLEQGRSIVWSQFLHLRTPVDELRVKHAALADQFEHISRELQRVGSRNGDALLHSWSNSTRSFEEAVQRHHELALKRDKLLVEIRSLPGFEQFLLPKTIEQLAVLAGPRPVVYVNASEHRCDALIIKPGSSSVIAVPLIGLSHRNVEAMCSYLLKHGSYSDIVHGDVSAPALPSEEQCIPQDFPVDDVYDDREGVPDAHGVEGHSPDNRFRRVLGILWKKVVNPVLVALDLTLPIADERLEHIFWCPTGPFSFLPIHAAGLYGMTHPGTKLYEFAISSYIPTLSALAPTVNSDASGRSSNIHLVMVPQPPNDGQIQLPGVKDEIDCIETLCSDSPCVTLLSSTGTVEDVMTKMTDADWIHFACHGIQDFLNPLDSGLCLADHRRLKLLDIIQLSRPQGGLAFLSACQTAQGDERLSEESVHLAAGMLLAGYGSVVATMWSILDRDAPKVTRKVYEHLFRDGKVPDSTEAAEALHYAVRDLHDSGAPFNSWVPFIHVGR